MASASESCFGSYGRPVRESTCSFGQERERRSAQREGLGQVRDADSLASREIRDGPCHTQAAVYRSNGQADTVDGIFQETSP